MTIHLYHLVAMLLSGRALVAVILCVGFFVAALTDWRGPHRRSRLRKAAIGLLAVPILIATQRVLYVGVFLPALGRDSLDVQEDPYAATSIVHVGDPAPVFALKDTRGEAFDLERQKGKVVLINFFATWCGPCMMELPHLERLWKKHHSSGGFELIVIGHGETEKTVSAFRSRKGFSFTMAADPDDAVWSRYALEAIPRNYLIGPDGKIVFTSTGFYEPDLERLEAELVKQLGTARTQGEDAKP